MIWRLREFLFHAEYFKKLITRKCFLLFPYFSPDMGIFPQGYPKGKSSKKNFVKTI